MALSRTTTLVALALLCASTTPTHAGGAWVPKPGEGDIQLGASQKKASTSWDSRGNGFVNRNAASGKRTYHDFRYGYLSGEVGLWNRVSARFLMTYLDGREGPKDDIERNTGLSDAWFGVKYALRQDSWPMALAFTYRTPIFYDLPGAYNRHLFDSNGDFRGVSPEWRGLLKEDYSFTYLASHSIAEGRGWWNLELGYTFRNGAPSDEVPFSAEIGYPLPWLDSSVKGTFLHVQPVGNDSPRKPDDRFGSRPGFNFNNAQVGRGGVSWIVPFGRDKQWSAEVGYNHWLYGRSARQYTEPYVSIGRRF